MLREATRVAVFTAVLLGLFSGTASGARLYAPMYGGIPPRVAGFEPGGDGSLAPLSGSPFAIVPGAAEVSGLFAFAFTPEGNRAAAGYFDKGGAVGITVGNGGSLSAAGEGIESASANGLAVSPDGRFAYTSTQDFMGDPAEGIRGYSIGADGELTALPASFGTGQFQDVAITPDGRFLYSTAAGEIWRFAINADGTLSELGKTPVDGVNLAVSPDGRHLFAGMPSGAEQGVRSFSIAADGSLSENGAPALTGDEGLGYFAVAPDGRHLYMPDDHLEAIVTAAIAPDGTLSVVGTTPAEIPETVGVSPDGRFLYEGTGGPAGSITAASIGPDGVPSPLPFTAEWKGGEPLPLVFQPTQPPVARFSMKPAEPGSNSTFDAGGSSGAASYDWNFGDGTTLLDAGPRPAHRYRRAGRYEVRLTVTNESGCSAQQIYTGQSTVCAAAPQATTTALLDTPPGIRRLKVTKRKFAVGQSRGQGRRAARIARRKKVKVGTAFRYRLTERARVRFTIERKLRGRVVGGKCRRITRRNRARKRCVRLRRVGVLSQRGKAGANRRRFSGRLKRKRLSPGRYRATAVAIDAAGGRSAPRRVSFQVVRG